MRGGIAFCCNCGNCVIDADDFNRADSASIGGKWSVVSGTPSIASNQLVFASAGEITFLQEHTGLTARARVVARVIPITSGLIVELQIAKSGVNDFLGVRFDFGFCHTMQLFKCVGGTKTLLGNSVTITDRFDTAQLNTIEICWDPNLFRLRAKATPFEGNALMVEITDDTLVGGLRSGIKCSSLAYFDNYSFEWMGAASDVLRGFCPECTAGCLIDSDTFNTDNECKWDLYDTRGTVTGGTLISSGETRLFRNAASSDTAPTILTATVALQNVPGVFDMLIGAEDNLSYHLGRLSATDSTEWKLLVAAVGNAGVSEVTFTADPTRDYILELCFTPDDNVTTITVSQEYTPDRVILSTGWTDPNNALLLDGSNALYGMGGAPPVTSDELRLEFDRDPLLPSGKTLTNIKVEFWAGHDGSSTNVVAQVLVNGVFDGVSYALASGSKKYEAFGLWNLTTTNEVNAELRVGLRFVDSDTGTAQITVDYMRVTIFYADEDADGGYLKLSIRDVDTGGQIACAQVANILPLGTKAGFSVNTGQTWFIRDITYQYGYSDTLPQCPKCSCNQLRPCSMCLNAKAPRYLAMTISNLTSHPAPYDCPFCETLDGTYILEKWDNYPWFGAAANTSDAPNPFNETWGCGFDGGEVCGWGIPLRLDPDDPDRITGLTVATLKCGGMRLLVNTWAAVYGSGPNQIDPPYNMYLCMSATIRFCPKDFVAHVGYYGKRLGPFPVDGFPLLDGSVGFDCLNFNNEVFPLLDSFGVGDGGGTTCGCTVPSSITLTTL